MYREIDRFILEEDREREKRERESARERERERERERIRIPKAAYCTTLCSEYS